MTRNENNQLKKAVSKHQIIKRNIKCAEECNDKNCVLRSGQKLDRKGCKCSSSADHCYYCYRHICTACTQKPDKLSIGQRCCLEGECEVREGSWEDAIINPTPTKSNNTTDEKNIQEPNKQEQKAISECSGKN